MNQKWWTLIAVAVGVFMLLVDITIVNVALPDIERALHASLADLQWVLDAYALSLAALLLTAGSLADRFGRRLLFAIGIVVFTAGSLLCGLASDPTFLALARAGQGVGGALMFATALALLSGAYRGRDRGVAFGVFGAVTGVAVAVGPVLGGILTSGISWRWIFFVNIPIGVVALVITLTRVVESRDPHPRRLDWIGFLTFSLGLAGLVYGLIRSHADGWGATNVAGSLIAAAVLLVAFVVAERVQREPMFDLGLLRKPAFVGGLFAAFAVSASIFSLLTYLVLYVQNVLGYSAVEAGVRFLVFSGVIFFCAGIAGRATGRVPARLLIGPGFALVGAGLLLMRGITPESGWTHLIPGFIVAGIGTGFINVPLASAAVSVVEPARAGMASGVNTTFRQVGIATGIAGLGSIFASKVSDTVAVALAGTPLSGRASALGDAVADGAVAQAIASTPASAHQLLARAANQGFIDGLNSILLIGAVVAFLAGVASLVLIRERDFVAAPAGEVTPGAATDEPVAVAA
jgi:EmrB/QacA subfamily drug resistance transporter